MMLVFDTNVISELVKANPAPSVLTILRKLRPEDVFTTAISLAEIWFGLALMPLGQRRTGIEQRMDSILTIAFGNRILPFDSTAARAYAALRSAHKLAGRPLGDADAQIAAIVRSNGATLVTRNTKDFENCGFEVINPWK